MDQGFKCKKMKFRSIRKQQNFGKVFYHNYLFIFIKKTKIQFVFWGN